jgi:hypothetical protein
LIVLDVNVLVYAHRKDVDRHAEYKGWLRRVGEGDEPFAVPDVSMVGFVRVVTNARIWRSPTPLGVAFDAVRSITERPNFVRLAPPRAHWAIFERLCREADAKGNLVTDAYLASLAVATGGVLVTTDRDHARFPGLRWQHPLDG